MPTFVTSTTGVDTVHALTGMGGIEWYSSTDLVFDGSPTENVTDADVLGASFVSPRYSALTVCAPRPNVSLSVATRFVTCTAPPSGVVSS